MGTLKSIRRHWQSTVISELDLITVMAYTGEKNHSAAIRYALHCLAGDMLSSPCVFYRVTEDVSKPLDEDDVAVMVSINATGAHRAQNATGREVGGLGDGLAELVDGVIVVAGVPAYKVDPVPLTTADVFAIQEKRKKFVFPNYEQQKTEMEKAARELILGKKDCSSEKKDYI